VSIPVPAKHGSHSDIVTELERRRIIEHTTRGKAKANVNGVKFDRKSSLTSHQPRQGRELLGGSETSRGQRPQPKQEGRMMNRSTLRHHTGAKEARNVQPPMNADKPLSWVRDLAQNSGSVTAVFGVHRRLKLFTV
jgi:hypothetical protein